MWVLAGTLGASGLISQSLFLVTLFCTYLRPSAQVVLYAVDLIPRSATRGSTC